ncbi:MAG: hypothetical protein ACYC7E_11045 [Armatimonadota bacterium]
MIDNLHVYRISLLCALMALCLGLFAGHGLAAADEGNLVVNPGFEQPAAANSFLGWVFVNHNQDFIRGEIQAQEYQNGLHAAMAVVPETPKVYACWGQHVKAPDDTKLPNTFSIWYRSPDAPCHVVMTFTAVVDGKSVNKGVKGLTLPISRGWRQFSETIETPAGTRDILLELRVSAKGTYHFDDVVLNRTEAVVAGLPCRLLFVGMERNQLSALWQETLGQAGFVRLSYEKWDNLTPALLKQCRAVILISTPRRQLVTPKDEAITEMLLDYLKAGGGLMITQQFGQMHSEMTLPMYLLERLGGKILLETLVVPKEANRPFGHLKEAFAYTDKVRGPWADGVTGVWYPTSNPLGVWASELPFLPNAEWQVALSGGQQTKTELYLTGLDEIDRGARAQGFAEDVPLAGYRDFAKGRAAYMGFHAQTVFTRGTSEDDAKSFAAYMRDGTDGKPSGMLRFYANAIRWLGANADPVAAVDLKLREVATSKLTTAWKMHRGIIGPRTRYSSGQNTPDEYVAKAKAAGLDYLVFLEDFVALQPGAFEKLKADCRRLTGEGFLAVPGITFQNDQGNHEFIFSDTLLLPSKKLLEPTGKRVLTYTPSAPWGKNGNNVDIHWWYTLLGFESTSGYYNFRQNPYPFYDGRDINAIAIVLQEGGKTLERLPEAHGYQARSGQFTWPVALTLMRNAAELDGVKNGSVYVNVIGAEGLAQVSPMLTTITSRTNHLYPGMTSFGAMYLTNGPDIQLTMPRGDTDAGGNPYNPNLQEWSLKMNVTSAAGIREVKLYDGETVLRRFLPNGAKEFSFATSIAKERQRAVWVQATDMQGKEAIGRDIPSNSWLLRENQCSDRNNQLLDSRQLRPDGTPFFVGYGGDTVMPDKGPWNGRFRPVGCFVFDKKLGVGAFPYDGSPENHPQASFAPYLVYDGKVPSSKGWSYAVVADKEGGPHVKPQRVVACSDVLVGERVLDGVFPVDAYPVIHVWHTLYPVQPSTYLKTTGRAYLYRIKPDGISAYLWDQEFTILQDIPVKMDVPFMVGIGTFSAVTATERITSHQGTVTEQGPLKGYGMKALPFDAGDYLGLTKSPFGSMVAYSLTDGLTLWGDGVNYRVGIKPTGTVLKAGTKLRAKILLVGMHRGVTDPAALAAKVRADYGLAGKASYAVEVKQGAVTDQQYILRAAANKEGLFQSTIRGLAALDGNLGGLVSSLHDSWTAVFQQQDGQKVKTRLIPVEGGIGYLLWQAEDDGKLTTIGHPLIASDPKVTLNLTRSTDWKTWHLEIHNPSDKQLQVTVRANPAFAGFQFNEALTLAPGSSVIRNLGPVKE